MIVLALDTTARRGGYALLRDGALLAERTREPQEGFATVLFSDIEGMLADVGLALEEIDVYAAASGPGSFTGIRVGLTAVKALAEVHGKPVVPVSNLEALAFAGSASRRAAVLDARRERVYAAVYDANLQPLVPEAAYVWSEFRATAGQAEFLGLDPAVFSPDGAAPLDHVKPTIVPNLAAFIACLAARRIAQGRGSRPEQVEANYVRRPDAERNWKVPGG